MKTRVGQELLLVLQRLDDTGKNLMRGQESIMNFNLVRFHEQKLLLARLNENDKQLFQNQENIMKVQIGQFIKQQEWFQVLDDQNKKLLEGQANIIGLQYNQLLYLDNVNEIQGKIYREQMKLRFEQEAYNKRLDENMRKLFVGQSMLLMSHVRAKEELDKIVYNIDELKSEVQRTQVVAVYAKDYSHLKNMKDLFEKVFGPYPADYQIQFFRDGAGSMEFLNYITNIQGMLIGNNNILLGRSLYDKIHEYCKPEIHAHFMNILSEGFMFRSTALEMAGFTIAQNEVDQFVENNVDATVAYVTHCGCPDGFVQHYRGFISQLLPSLEPSNDTSINNAMKICLLGETDIIWRFKALTLLKHKNFNILATGAWEMIEETSFEDIELAIQMDNEVQRRHLEYFDNKKSCIDRKKNGIVEENNDGGWSEWSDYGDCYVGYSSSIQTRHRECNSPEPSNGGSTCAGDASETKKCLQKTFDGAKLATVNTSTWLYDLYKVQATGIMTTANVVSTCKSAGLEAVCYQVGEKDSNCKLIQRTIINEIIDVICPGKYHYKCKQLENVFVYMKSQGIPNGWGEGGLESSGMINEHQALGRSYTDGFALCSSGAYNLHPTNVDCC